MLREFKRNYKTKGTMIFSAPDSYFKHDKHDIFMMFEEEMGKTSPQTQAWFAGIRKSG